MRLRVTPTSLALAAAALLALTTAACAAPQAQLRRAAPDAGRNVVGDSAPATALRSGERFMALSMARPYTPVPPNGGTDEYRCFLMDPHLTQGAFVTGSQFLPQNAAIVHHAIFFRVNPADIDQAKSLDSLDPGDGWTCFGESGIRSRGGPQAFS